MVRCGKTHPAHTLLYHSSHDVIKVVSIKAKPGPAKLGWNERLEMSSGGGVSLEEAIRSKYCCQEDEEDLPATRLVKEAAVYLRPGLALSLNSTLFRYTINSYTLFLLFQ